MVPAPPRPPTQRLFFAAWPPPETAAALHGWAERVREDTGGRVSRPETLHLTLVFLGDLPETSLPSAVEAARAVRGAVHDLKLEEAQGWARQQLVWAGPRLVPVELTTLVRDLSAALVARGFELEPRPFAAHVTLLRKARVPAQLPPVPPLPWPVREFVLVQSTLAPSGPRYAVLERFGLEGA